jgi:hypothetical protein
MIPLTVIRPSASLNVHSGDSLELVTKDFADGLLVTFSTK